MTHVPRGARVDLAGATVLAVGGAYSIDKHYRLGLMDQAEDYYGRRRE